jgi:hypothetical protein
MNAMAFRKSATADLKRQVKIFSGGGLIDKNPGVDK